MQINKMLMAIFVIGLVVFAIAPAVHAEDSNSAASDDEDNSNLELSSTATSVADIEALSDVSTEDISMFKEKHGAEVRLLQLQKKVVRHIKMGEIIIDAIDNQNFSVDTSNLEDYVDDLRDLNETISEELSQDPVNVSVEEFVSMKHEAIRITYQFKAELYTILTAEQLKVVKEAIKDKVKLAEKDELKIDDKLHEKIKEYNKEVALKMFGKFGGLNNQTRADIEAGKLDAKELKEKLKEEYGNLGQARKMQVSQKIKEEQRNESREKLETEGRVAGLNRSEVANIMNDDSLTMDEKQAKVRVLMQERKTQKSLDKEDKLVGESCSTVTPGEQDNCCKSRWGNESEYDDETGLCAGAMRLEESNGKGMSRPNGRR